MFWSAGDAFARQGLQFAVAVVLARLLSPADFGVVAMLYVFSGIAGVFIDSGLTPALIQCRAPNHGDESSVFYFNVAMATIVALGLGMAAPAIARFFGHPVLVPLTWVMGLTMVIGSLGGVHAARLERALDFRGAMRIAVTAALVSGLVAAVVAAAGAGVWALAAQALTASAVNSALLWRYHHWRPGRDASLASLRLLLGFGGFVLVTRLLDTLYTRAYSLIIGKLFDAATLGLYNRGQATQQLPAGVVGGILNRVAFPLFSQSQEDPGRMANGIGQSTRAIMLVNAPLMLGLAVTAQPLVNTLFGPAWLGSVPVLQVLCLAGLLSPLEVINLSAMAAQGRPDLILRIEVVKKVVGIAAVVLASFHGVMAIAWCQVGVAALGYWLNARVNGARVGYPVGRQVRDLLPYLALASTMAMLLWRVASHLELPAPAELVLLVLVGGAFYLAGCWVLRLDAFMEMRRRLSPVLSWIA